MGEIAAASIGEDEALWRFCGVWLCDSLQRCEKMKIRSLAKHNVFAVLLTPPQGESQRTENPYLSVLGGNWNPGGGN